MNHMIKVFVASAVLAVAAGCNTADTSPEQDDEGVGSEGSALTAAQCNYFAVSGKVQICHRTGSAAHPYSVLKISEQACINAHALHAGDYVAVNDPTCQGGGCLPESAPCDATLPCCEGFSCTGGTCTPNVSDHCDPNPCQNGSTCINGPDSYTCECIPGYVGANCETEIDECASTPCVNGTCYDGVNEYTCECDFGWAGTNCDVYTLVPLQCDGADFTVDVLPSDCEDLDEMLYTCNAVWGPVSPVSCGSWTNPCASNPCQNGSCSLTSTTSYECTCNDGWTGTNCDISTWVPLECEDAPFTFDVPPSVCEDLDEMRWQFCQPAFNSEPVSCGSWTSPCASNPCQNGSCSLTGLESYACTCNDGWTGTNCETEVGTCPCAGYAAWDNVLAVQLDECVPYLGGFAAYGNNGSLFSGLNYGTTPYCGAEDAWGNYIDFFTTTANMNACVAQIQPQCP